MTAPRPKENKKQLLQKLVASPDQASRHRLLSRHKSLLQPEIVIELAERVRDEVRVDVQHALQLAEAAVVIAAKLGNQESQAWAFRAKANALYVTGQHAAAVDLHHQAEALFDAAGNTHELGRTLSGSIQPLLLLGQYNRAFSAAERAKQIFLAERDEWRLARLEINVGNIYYRQDRFAEALGCYERAYQGLPAQQDPEGVAAVLSNIATCCISLSEFSKALDAYQQARTFCQEHAMPLLVTQADYNIAYLHYLRGEYSKAIQMLRTTRQNSQQIKDAYHEALCNLDLAELYLDLNLGSEAAELAQQGFEGFQKLGMGYESAKCLAFSAIAASQQGHAFEGLELFARAREMFVREKNQAWPSLIDLYRALIFFQEGRLFEARRLATEAHSSLSTLHIYGKAITAELVLARIALQNGDIDEALQHANHAVSSLAQMESPPLSYQAHLLLGNIHRARKDPASAYAAYQVARDALEGLRSGIRGEELKIAFLKNRLEIYENLAELCLNRGTGVADLEEAFTYMEQAKSRTLMDLFIRPAPAPAENEAAVSELVRSIRDLREELNYYYSLIEREQLQPEVQTPDRIAALHKQAQHREKELLRMLRDASETEAAQAGLHAPTSVALPAIREAIPTDTLLVEFFQIRDRVLVCLLGPQRLQILAVTLEARVLGILRLLQFQLAKFHLHPEYLETFQESLVAATQAHLRELYEELIAPITPNLQSQHLIFVPHGALHYVPFHALFDGREYLADRHTISYAPSASVFTLSRQRSVNPSGASLIFGVPDSQAPAIADEVKALAGILPDAELFLGPQANEDALRRKGPHSRLIHIATHGHFRQDNPMFSAIRLGDSFLSLYDLYNLQLPVDLITLSGCSTGLNVVSAGDELIGLARGLLHAGAKSLVLSLWDVHDKSTSEFMTSFYGFLLAGSSKAQALRQAAQQLKSRYPHPYQWAPFVLVGQP